MFTTQDANSKWIQLNDFCCGPYKAIAAPVVTKSNEIIIPIATVKCHNDHSLSSVIMYDPAKNKTTELIKMDEHLNGIPRWTTIDFQTDTVYFTDEKIIVSNN